MKKINKVSDLKVGEWYWRDYKAPVRAVKRGRWVFFVGGNWIQPYPAGQILRTHDIHGPIPKPEYEAKF